MGNKFMQDATFEQSLDWARGFNDAVAELECRTHHYAAIGNSDGMRYYVDGYTAGEKACYVSMFIDTTNLGGML